MTTRRRVLVTGASAGIGAAFAHVFAQHGFDLVLTARREDRLQAVAADCRSRWDADVRVIVADLAQIDAPRHLYDEIDAAGLSIDALVNNAGYGVTGEFVESPWQTHADFLQVMVTSVAELTHRFLPAMLARGYGRIVNVSSLAGLVPATAKHTLYAPSKAFLIKFSESLALEGQPHGVHVTALCPGFTYTEFHDANHTREEVARQVPRWMWMDAEEVAAQGFDAVMAGRPICITGRVNRSIAFLTKHLPDRVMSWFVQRESRRYRKQ